MVRKLVMRLSTDRSDHEHSRPLTQKQGLLAPFCITSGTVHPPATSVLLPGRPTLLKTGNDDAYSPRHRNGSARA